MAGAIELGIVGKITYYTIVVYLLFIVGLVIVCRASYKSHQARKKNNCNDSSRKDKDMGLFQSKSKGGYNVDESGELRQRNVEKYARQDNTRTAISENRPSSNGQTSVVEGKDQVKLKAKRKSREINEVASLPMNQDNRENEQKSSIDSSKIASLDKSRTNEFPDIPVSIKEITNDNATSANQNQVKKTTKGTEKFQSAEEIVNENMGRPNPAKDFKVQGSFESPPAANQLKVDTRSENIADRDPEKIADSSVQEVKNKIYTGETLGTLADKMSSKIVNITSSDIDSRRDKSPKMEKPRTNLNDLAEAIVDSSLNDGLSEVEDQNLATGFANELATSIVSDVLLDESLFVTVKKALIQKKELSIKIRTNAEKTSSKLCKSIVDDVYKDASLCSRSIGNFSENLSSEILDCAIDSSLRADCSSKALVVRGDCQFEKNDSKTTMNNMEEQINSFSNQFAGQVLGIAMDDLGCKSSQKMTPDEEDNVQLPASSSPGRIIPELRIMGPEDKPENSESGFRFFSPMNTELDTSDQSRQDSVFGQSFDADDETEDATSESESEKEIISPVVLRNKSLLKLKLHTDRPLSSYAEQLAGFLADDDDSLNLFESDDEFDAVLDKMEEKYRDHEKLNMKIQRRRKQSESRGPGSSTVSPMYDKEQRGRIESTQSDCSFISGTDTCISTDDALRGSFSDDQALSPGFCKFLNYFLGFLLTFIR